MDPYRRHNYAGLVKLGVSTFFFGEMGGEGGPYNKDYRILGSILGSPYLEKLPYIIHNSIPTSISCCIPSFPAYQMKVSS